MPLLRPGLGLLLSILIAAPATAHDPKPSGAVDPSSTQSEAAGVLDRFHEAVRTGRLADAAAQLSEDALIFEGGGAERGKAEYVEHHLPADAIFAKTVTRTVLRRAEGRDGALTWIATESRTVGEAKGRAIDVLSTETAILRRIDGHWRIVHLHWSSAR